MARKEGKNRRFSSKQLYLVQQQKDIKSLSFLIFFSKFASPKAVLTKREGQFSVSISMHTHNTYFNNTPLISPPYSQHFHSLLTLTPSTANLTAYQRKAASTRPSLMLPGNSPPKSWKASFFALTDSELSKQCEAVLHKSINRKIWSAVLLIATEFSHSLLLVH